MQKQKFIIKNRLGLHARAAAQLVQTANQFKADVTLVKDDVEVSGKSIMGVLLLAAPQGTDIVLSVEGPDETEAMIALAGLIGDGFGED
ncbi:MAG: HPr family phosphocarrier protein [Desulfuromonadales bacterium]|nr:HPr family phosphocarrier protein [Desulfuromonadales bacterium]NOQ52575.1 HPr family phosphocarrier protein [Desulfuromonadaceae bacterium]